MHRSTTPNLRIPLGKRLRPLAYALVAMVAFILLLTWATVQLQTTLAGFLNGESLWSKSQKQAVIDLNKYAASGGAADYAGFQRNYAVLEAYRSMRNQILSGKYSYAKVEQTLRRARLMPVAIPGIIFMLDHFHNAPYLRKALQQWKSTDGATSELKAIALGLHNAYGAGAVPAAEVAREQARINNINDFIQPRSEAFSVTLAKGAVWVGRVSFCGVLGLAIAAVLLWLLMARRALARIRGSEERYRLLFDSAPDAILMVDENDGRIVDANRTAGMWTGRAPEDLTGVAYASLFDPNSPRDGGPGGGDLFGIDGSTRPVETQSSMAAWGERVVRQAIVRDVTERVESERERRVAAEALASIAEGVIIADSERRVVSVNSAATLITGFTAESLLGTRLDESRCMPDGSPLPAQVWDDVAKRRHWSGDVVSCRGGGSTYAERLSISTILDARRQVQHYVAVFSDISVAQADRHRLEHLAAHDGLTNLVNRPRFQLLCGEAIQRAALDRGAVAVVVLFIDLDAFKFVNDSYSHAVGDHLLKAVAERIQQQLRGGEVAGRIGGDEFTVLLPALELREDAAGLAGRLVAALAEPFHIDGYEIAVSASIGIAGYPLDGNDAKTLIANADAAMYAAKTEERNTWRFYTPVMQADARRQMVLAAELRQALTNHEFRLVFQPSVELRTERIVAAEALLRWQHPERGEVMPDQFIHIAENTGLIHRIDEWVMHAACAQIHAWDESDMPRIRLAINVSARWFTHPGFIESVRHALLTNDIAAQRVVLEVTEGAILRLGERTERTMRDLHAMGIGVAIDDFGTGYASMAYLKLPTVTYLKIDGSFIAGLPGSADDAAITTAMLAMADSLGLVTIAEGIETDAQHGFLLNAGCVEGQGYLYSYPLPPPALERLLRPKQRLAPTKLKLVPHRN